MRIRFLPYHKKKRSEYVRRRLGGGDTEAQGQGECDCYGTALRDEQDVPHGVSP